MATSYDATIEDFLKKYELLDKHVSLYNNDTIQKITEIANGKINNHVNSENDIVLLYMGLYYEFAENDAHSAEKYFLLSIKYNNTDKRLHSACAMGCLYEKQRKLDLAEEYYLMAIKYENNSAMNNLGHLYEYQNKLDLAEKYFLLAIEHNNSNAMYNLGHLYYKQNKLDLAEKYFVLAVNNGNDFEAMNCLGFIYETQYKLELAEKYYLMATTNHNCPNAMYNLGDLYEKQHKFDLAAKYYLKAISFNVGTVKNIAGIIPKVSHEIQLEILELVVQIRTNEGYFMNIAEEVRTLFANKQMEMTRCLSNYLIDDLVNICLSYY